MKIAIITGASSGLGARFAARLPDFFPEVEECLLLARRADRLTALSGKRGGVLFSPVSLDVADGAEIDRFTADLAGR